MNNNKKELVECMEFDNVDKISDDVYNLGSNLILRFNVILTTRPVNSQQKRSYHKEFEYINRFQEKSVTIRRSFDYYLSLENVIKDSATGEKIFIRIGLGEFFLFKQVLEKAASWFSDPKYNKLFVKDNKGKLRLAEPIPETVLTDLPMDRSLRLVPCIVEKGMSLDDQRFGIRIYYSNDYNGYADLDIGRFMGLVYLISTFNMYQCALELINYIGRPEFGYNRIDLDTLNGSSYAFKPNDTYNQSEEKTTGIKGRKPLGAVDLNDLEG